MQNQLVIFSGLVLLAVVSKLTSRRLYAVIKTLPILFILLLALLRPVAPPGMWLLGLFFGLAGDFFLLSGKGFIPGLLSFLIGHLFYVSAFAQGNAPTIDILPAFALALTSLGAYAYLAKYLVAGRRKRYLVPVFVYVATTAILLMQAVASGNLYSAVPGAVCFAVSDFLLAFDKFVRPSWYVQAGVSLTYYPAQWLLATYFAGS